MFDPKQLFPKQRQPNKRSKLHLEYPAKLHNWSCSINKPFHSQAATQRIHRNTTCTVTHHTQRTNPLNRRNTTPTPTQHSTKISRIHVSPPIHVRGQRQGQVHRVRAGRNAGSVPRRFCVPVQRAGAAPAEGRPSNSRGGTMTWRGGAESRPRGDQHSIQIVPIIHGERSDCQVGTLSAGEGCTEAGCRDGSRRRGTWRRRLLLDGKAAPRRKRPGVRCICVASLMYAQKTVCRCTFLTLNSAGCGRWAGGLSEESCANGSRFYLLPFNCCQSIFFPLDISVSIGNPLYW